MALGITGQKTPKAQQTYASHLLAPVVMIGALSDIDSFINNTALSGKQEGAWVITEAVDGTLSLAVASGSKPEDKWFPVQPDGKVTPV